MNGIVVIAMEVETYVRFLAFAVANDMPHFELGKFFDIEQFKTLEEVEAWWLDK